MVLLRILIPILLILTAFPAAAQQQPLDLELVLAADGSGSIDDEELALQRQGYADAITDPTILDIIQSGYYGSIAVVYVEWGGPFSQHTIVDWTVISDEASARSFATALLAAPRQAEGYNSISAVIDYAVTLIETNPFAGLRRIIDVSGDGPNIGGRSVRAARDDAVNMGITINALVVKARGGGFPGLGGEALVDHYERDVIGGLGAFVKVADETTGFGEAIRQKMILEIAINRP
ncbi:MAG: DUF1194 domain-containing protein [Alphaproteobacteria bacterium]